MRSMLTRHHLFACLLAFIFTPAVGEDPTPEMLAEIAAHEDDDEADM